MHFDKVKDKQLLERPGAQLIVGPLGSCLQPLASESHCTVKVSTVELALELEVARIVIGYVPAKVVWLTGVGGVGVMLVLDLLEEPEQASRGTSIVTIIKSVISSNFFFSCVLTVPKTYS